MSLFCVLAILLMVPRQQDPTPKVGEWVRQLGSDDAAARDQATRTLKGLGKAALPELKEAARDANPEIATRADYLLRVIPVLEKATPELLKAIPGVEDRLAKGGPDAWSRVLLEVIEEWSKGKHQDVRSEEFGLLAREALRGAKTIAEKEQVLNAIVDLFGGSEEVPGLKAPESVAGDLLLLLRDPEPKVRSVALTTLGELTVRSSFPEIWKLRKDEDPHVRKTLLSVMPSIMRPEDAPALLPVLRDESTAPEVHGRILDVIGMFSARLEPEKAREAADAVLQKVPVVRLQARAAIALGQLASRLEGEQLERAADAVLLLEDRNPAKAHALGTIILRAPGPLFERALAPLLKMLSDENAGVCSEAAQALFPVVDKIGSSRLDEAIAGFESIRRREGPPKSVLGQWLQVKCEEALATLKKRKATKKD